MKPARSIFLAVTFAAAFGAAGAEPLSDADARYVERVDGRFSHFAGSSANLESLATGLRSGSEITLAGSGETAIFTPPTRPMGYGNITRALDFAMRDLAAAGIENPTPSEIQAALSGGTVSTATGDITFQGVLQLRSQGMGWGQIAHSIGVHPGLGLTKSVAAPVTGASGITTAAGAAVVRPGTRTGQGAKHAPSTNRGSALGNAAGAAGPSSASNQGFARGQGGLHATSRGGGKFR